MRKVAAAAVLFLTNAIICLPLFRVEYLDQWQSNEGALIAIGKFLAANWPHVRWFPLFNGGMPIEATYLPLTPVLAVFGAHGLHAAAALAYCLAPVFWFVLAERLSGAVVPSFLAALVWSVAFGAEHLTSIVFYGEIPHFVALALVPLALWVVCRRPAWGVIAVAAVLLANAFGIVTIAVCLGILSLLYGRPYFAALPVAYLLVARMIPPSVIATIVRNSPTVAGDYRPTLLNALGAVVLSGVLAASWRLLRKHPPVLRFSCAFLVCFGGLVLLRLLPQPFRYQPEAEIALCLTLVFTLWPAWPRATAALCVVAVLATAAWDYRTARRLIRPADLASAPEYRMARWISSNLPGRRVMASSQAAFWFNVFASNPQLSGGHEPSAPNWEQRVAVFTIYSGENAGGADGATAVLWLKAFGCGAITVPGPASRDAYHPFRDANKFEGLLPVLWRENGDSIYAVPQRTPSLAHVVPSAAVVRRRPIHGLDTGDVARYVAALDQPSLPSASLTWKNPESGQIHATVAPGQLVSVQMTYDRGWRAEVNNKGVPLSADGLGLILIDPQQTGECTITLRFTEGLERIVCFAVSCGTAIVLLFLALNPTGSRGSPSPSS